MVAGLAVVLVIAGGLVWWFGSFRARPWVPTCTDIAPSLRAELGGVWTVTDPDKGREKGKYQSSSLCTISFITADQKYTGTLDLFTVVALDQDAGRDDVAQAQCGATDQHVPVPPDYAAFRVCVQTTSLWTRVTTWAAANERWGSSAVQINLRDDEQGAVAYANDLSRLAMEKALTMSEPE
ncbi:hypothetical protein BJY16_007362 [Actinoplanes octamycinicus]|uniref:Uncharacterized protein n=1 Tax=Actinoplanes octamycinicus TaxID=135948 RepID=A0A7W7H4R2_9ACTN|nr:hypothetical protein [Actinoplanes octamycinicus]MBB4743903.1 hypothetical protein [Actinoplanes octamycinicus]